MALLTCKFPSGIVIEGEMKVEMVMMVAMMVKDVWIV